MLETWNLILECVDKLTKNSINDSLITKKNLRVQITWQIQLHCDLVQFTLRLGRAGCYNFFHTTNFPVDLFFFLFSGNPEAWTMTSCI